MPVFRVTAEKIPADVRESLLQKLKQERQDPSPSGEPAVFEIPVEEPDRIDVLVVWKEWEDVPSAERTNVIMEAYEDQRDKLAQAVGVTYEEAMQQQLLPYSIVSRFEVSPKFLSKVYLNPDEAAQRLMDIRNAKLELGGARRSGGNGRSPLSHSKNGRASAVGVAHKTSEWQLVRCCFGVGARASMMPLAKTAITPSGTGSASP